MDAPVARGSSPYLERKLADQCEIKGCNEPPGDYARCPKHRAKQLEAKRASDRRRRKARRRRGVCAFCPRKSKRYRCLACKIRLDSQRKLVNVSAALSADTQQIAKRTTTSVEKGSGKNAWARTRYRGRDRRGKPPHGWEDEHDLDDAIRALVKAKDGLRLARSHEVANLPRIQRRDAIEAALSNVDLAVRHAGDVAHRNHYELTPWAPDDGTGDDESTR